MSSKAVEAVKAKVPFSPADIASCALVWMVYGILLIVALNLLFGLSIPLGPWQILAMGFIMALFSPLRLLPRPKPKVDVHLTCDCGHHKQADAAPVEKPTDVCIKDQIDLENLYHRN